MQPVVSIITPAYNCENTLGETIKSVKRQSYDNWEHIIIDDFSRDNTRQLIKKFASEDSRIKPIYLDSNQGVANVRNRGILSASGKYIAFLDSDDLWKTDKLQKQISYMEENNYEFTYTDYEVIDALGNFVKNITTKKIKVGYKDLLNSNKIACLTVVIKSNIIKSELMPTIKHEDYATWLNILKKHVEYAYGFNEILASYRRLETSLSSNKLKTVGWTWNIYRNNQKLSSIKALKQLIIFGVLTSKKYISK